MSESQVALDDQRAEGPDPVPCPACHGQGVVPVRHTSAGASPHDSEERCDLCLGFRQVEPRLARAWKRGRS